MSLFFGAAIHLFCSQRSFTKLIIVNSGLFYFRHGEKAVNLQGHFHAFLSSAIFSSPEPKAPR